MKVLAAVLLVFLLVSGNSMAGNITIYDKESTSSTGWYGKQEDEEVEPGNMTGQIWDLEGAFLNGRTLTLVGGWDFKNGVKDTSWGQVNWDSGDIFIDINGDAKYGTDPNMPSGSGRGIQTILNSFGYDYVVDVNWAGSTFDIYKVDSSSKFTTAFFAAENSGANPWQYESGGAKVGSGSWIYSYGLTNQNTGFLGGTHYSAAFTDLLNLIPGGTSFLMHFTMECGNDNLIAAVPEPATLIISLSALAGSLGYLKRRKNVARAVMG